MKITISPPLTAGLIGVAYSLYANNFVSAFGTKQGSLDHALIGVSTAIAASGFMKAAEAVCNLLGVKESIEGEPRHTLFSGFYKKSYTKPLIAASLLGIASLISGIYGGIFGYHTGKNLVNGNIQGSISTGIVAKTPAIKKPYRSEWQGDNGVVAIPSNHL